MATIRLPRAWLKGTSDFSFSGIKTALLRLVEQGAVSSQADAAASFQDAVSEVLVTKTVAAARSHRVRQIWLAGGVAANSMLRERMKARSPLPVRIPPLVLCTDNAAMIAACGYYCLWDGMRDTMAVDVIPGLKLG
jgi:N6-L-threonylcarbamoyladenine synthase